MKYAFMSFSSKQLDLDETLSLASRLGYDGIEPREGHAHGVSDERSPAERRDIKQRAADAGVAICCLALGTAYADPAKTEEAVERTRRYIELAGDIGCGILRVFGGKIPNGVSRQAAIDHVAAALSKLAPDAASANAIVCLETHDDWTHPDHVAALMEAVDHPAVGVNWDMMHPTRASDVSIEAGFERLRPWIRHVHIHDGLLSEPLEFSPCGEGDLDMRAAFKCLVDSGYSGYASGEWINADETVDLAEELRRMKALESELRKQGA